MTNRFVLAIKCLVSCRSSVTRGGMKSGGRQVSIKRRYIYILPTLLRRFSLPLIDTMRNKIQSTSIFKIKMKITPTSNQRPLILDVKSSTDREFLSQLISRTPCRHTFRKRYVFCSHSISKFQEYYLELGI